ncbi:hypothetical protein [Photobacterium indicum]|uniref:Uncharacterized protein n=1 Tax=Photobacterium indicum TaxID=81447 RepID=A0A2T3L9R5_9GAMM|nr:hypothetical protein [Photobacterium indicum]PSV47745.1 hypothetical protein C9J47_12280 [Photobacterium indicum]
MFKDKFCKWPKLLRFLVFISLIPPLGMFYLVYSNLAPAYLLNETLTMVGSFNLILLTWGLLLKIRAKKYWYRSYHIGKTMLLALIPILACGYLLATDQNAPRVAQQVKSQYVEISIN